MKSALLSGIFSCIAVCALQAQYFDVHELKAFDPFEMESVFPELVAPESKSAWPEIAAERINMYLKYEILSKVHRNEGENPFSEVFPADGTYGGQGEFGYNFYSNNARFVSIGIGNTNTGAYSEYEERTYSFDSHHGEHLTFHDFFEGEHYDAIMRKVTNVCASMVHDYLANLDPEDEYAEDKLMLYEDCLSNFEGDGTPYFRFYLTDSSMVFTYGRCSSHAYAAIDDLWDFQVEYTFDELSSYLSDKGRALLFNEARQSERDAHLPERKVLKGTVDGKYEIYAIFHSLSGYYLNGVYWYDQYKKPIRIYGNLLEGSIFEFWEEVDGEKIARIELVYQNAQLMGVWERLDGSASMPIVLSAE